jgi:nucleoside-diphosphate-sugar epimerase
MADNKPQILILGGLGFVGRNLVLYLVEKDLCKFIRVVDKLTFGMAHLGKKHQSAMENSVVEFIQGNLSNPETAAKVFAAPQGEFDFVVNVAGESKRGEYDAVYQDRIFGVFQTVVAEAGKHQIKKFVEVSTAEVYNPKKKKPAKEKSKIKPWTPIANWKVKCEQLLTSSKIPYVILRPSIIYGPGDSNGIMPRVTLARLYKWMDEKMKFLWPNSLHLNTVHVNDVAKAIWHVANLKDKGVIYNLSDKNDTTQGKMNEMLEDILNIKTESTNSLLAGIAKLSMNEIVEDINSTHMGPWIDLCSKYDIQSTPLSPRVSPEVMKDNELYADGSAIEATGFTYEHPNIKKEDILEMINYWTEQSLFPPNKEDD